MIINGERPQVGVFHYQQQYRKIVQGFELLESNAKLAQLSEIEHDLLPVHLQPTSSASDYRVSL